MTSGEEEQLTVMVEVVKIDEETGNSYRYNLPLPRAILKGEKIPPESKDYDIFDAHRRGTLHAEVLRHTFRRYTNVGDFIIFEDKVYRRIRGGLKPATDDDLAELLAAKLGEVLEE